MPKGSGQTVPVDYRFRPRSMLYRVDKNAAGAVVRQPNEETRRLLVDRVKQCKSGYAVFLAEQLVKKGFDAAAASAAAKERATERFGDKYRDDRAILVIGRTLEKEARPSVAGGRVKSSPFTGPEEANRALREGWARPLMALDVLTRPDGSRGHSVLFGDEPKEEPTQAAIGVKRKQEDSRDANQPPAKVPRSKGPAGRRAAGGDRVASEVHGKAEVSDGTGEGRLQRGSFFLLDCMYRWLALEFSGDGGCYVFMDIIGRSATQSAPCVHRNLSHLLCSPVGSCQAERGVGRRCHRVDSRRIPRPVAIDFDRERGCGRLHLGLF